MSKFRLHITAVFILLVSLFALAGCGGGSAANPRINGLSPDGVVKTVFNEVQADQMNDAKAYLAPNTSGDSTSIQTMKNSNLISVKTVTIQGDYAVVLATMQQQNTTNFSVKPVGLEKINGEWYIVDVNNIYNNAKYALLQKLLSNI
ncbi:MAG: hypothetical protein H7X79_01010 [Sporomusaceae bacterium]|nr:hypothetical protein [Sporomusaceae bacterium]